MTNGTKLVIIPKEIALAIESLESEGYPPYEIMAKGTSVSLSEPISDEAKIFCWANGNGTRLNMLMDALVNGYQVEMTPEERVREYYADLRRSSEGSIYGYKAEAVVHALDLLGVSIPGVNAPDVDEIEDIMF